MNYHVEEHLLVKQNVTDALFGLMTKKPFSSIRITELIDRAGVARASYYRNFISKEDILQKYIRSVLDEFKDEFSIPDFNGRFAADHYRHVADYIKRYRDQLIILRDAGLSSLYLDELNSFLLENYAHLTEEETLLLFSFAGAEFNLIFNYILNQENIDYAIFETLNTLGIRIGAIDPHTWRA